MAKQKSTRSSGRWLFLLILLGMVWIAQYLLLPITPDRLPQDINIPSGQSLRGIANRLHENGLIPDPWRFILLAKVTGRADKIKAGVYRVTTPLTPPDLLRMLTQGESPLASLTIVEGWNWRQLRKVLNQTEYLKHDASQLSEQELATQLGIESGKVEGWFFPDTYHVARGSGELALLRRAHEVMQERLQKAWEQRPADSPLATPYEALTLASIIEKETGAPSDRPQVAAVFVNRLKKGMRLQTDPTVIYGLGESFDGNLRKIDLLTDTPFNTYTRSGLPPTPIAFPGMAAIQSALNPAPSAALYFVAKGDGHSVFSDNLSDHNNAVNRYQRRSKQ